MKKSIIIAALFIGFTLTSTSCKEAISQKTSIIDSFITNYFADTEVLAIIKDGLDYEVTLSDYTHIEFDGNLIGHLEWDEVDCKHASIYTEVPFNLVPAEITDYVNRAHGTQTIVKIAKDTRGWEIELSNGIEIEFDANFNVTEIDYKK